MHYAYCVASLLCLIGTGNSNCATKNESLKTMTDKNETIKTAGRYSAHDKHGTSIILEWQKTTMFAPEYLAIMKDVWPIARSAYLPTEMDFLRAFPHVVGTEDYYKPFEPLFKDGVATVNWTKAEAVQQELLKSHFVYDTSTWGPEVLAQFGKDVCYVITTREQKTNTLLGFITFMTRANYTSGDIKMMAVAVAPAYQRRGLGKLLMSTILKINPTVKHISLHTRVTNTTGLKAYGTCGFTKDAQPIMDYPTNLEHWTFLGYRVDKCNTLQKIAAQLTNM